MVRIVHTGDMHFDSPFTALPPAVARLRKEEQRDTFLRIVESVREYRAELLLIAGDMFDGRFVSADTVAFLKESFARIPETAVFIAPGNHDFLSPDSPYCTADFGENVHIFGDRLESVDTGEAVVYGYGFSQRFIKQSVLPAGRIYTGTKPGILLMHADIAGESDYNPISPGALSESGFTYAALGHVHAFSGISCAGDTRYAYCGIPEGRHFDEGGTCGYIRGEISVESANLEFVPVGKRQNVTLQIDVTGLSGQEAILQKIRTTVSPENLYKIVLCGEIPNTMYIDTALLQKEITALCLYAKVRDETVFDPGAAEESLLEKLFSQRLSGRDDEVGKMALREGLEALRRQRR